MSWHAGGRPPGDLDGALALRPALASGLAAFLGAVDAALDPALLAACRARVDALLAGEAPGPPPADARTAACVRFAEQFVTDVHGIGDDDVAALRAHLAPAEIVALVEALALAEGLGRLRAVLGLAAGGKAAR